MASRSEIWKQVSDLVDAEGLALFDLDPPSRREGLLRVYICRPESHSGGIGLEDCARVSRRLTGELRATNAPSSDWTIEVSSPGVNRRLRLPEHFDGAIGERVRVTFLNGDGAKQVVIGSLRRTDETSLVLEDEEGGTEMTIKRSDVEDARVDFLF